MTADVAKACHENLKRLYPPISVYTDQHKGMFPDLDTRPGHLMFAPNAVLPDFITHLTEGLCWSKCPASSLICPGDIRAQDMLLGVQLEESTAERFLEASSYWYLGFILPTEKDGLAFTAAYRELVRHAKSLPPTVTPHGASGLRAFPAPYDKIIRLKDGCELSYITDISNPMAGREVMSRIPIVVEKLGHHPGGAHVLYMDGHVEFVEYPGKYPMTEAFMTALAKLDSLRDQS